MCTGGGTGDWSALVLGIGYVIPLSCTRTARAVQTPVCIWSLNKCPWPCQCGRCVSFPCEVSCPSDSWGNSCQNAGGPRKKAAPWRGREEQVALMTLVVCRENSSPDLPLQTAASSVLLDMKLSQSRLKHARCHSEAFGMFLMLHHSCYSTFSLLTTTRPSDFCHMGTVCFGLKWISVLACSACLLV